jgi:hypothetical protein
MSARRSTSTQELLQQMSASVVPVEEPEAAALRRERVVARLGVLHDELDERRQRAARRTRRIAMLAVAALPLLAAGGYWMAKHSTGPTPAQVVAHAAPARLSVRSGSVLLAHGTAAERAVRGAEQLASGDRVHTARDGRARVRMPNGTDVEMSPVTQLTMGREVAGWRSGSVDLARGRVDVSVPKLPPGSSFEVVTPDSSVTVHGTHFTVIVEPDAAGKSTTRVVVRDGKVQVDSHGSRTLLGAGARWSSVPRAAAKNEPAPAAKNEPAANGKAGDPAAAAAKSPVASRKQAAAAPAVKTAGGTKLPDVSSASSLSEQNKLFQAAMDARRRGDNARALALLNQLLARYPGSPLEQDARVERFRALKRLGRGDQATRAARRYLAEHPEGFARDEARQMALDPDGG